MGEFLPSGVHLNSESDFKQNPQDQVSIADEILEEFSQPSSYQCSCSLFLKMFSAVALINSVVLLIVLHGSIGFVPGIISLGIGGLTLFAASREKKLDPPPSASVCFNDPGLTNRHVQGAAL